MRSKQTIFTLKTQATLVVAATAGKAAQADSTREPRRDGGKANPLKNVYFGEQHLYTSNSPAIK